MYSRLPPPHDASENESDFEEEANKTKVERSKNSSVDCESKSFKPKVVSQKLWERFQVLQKRTDEVTRRSTEKRIKHLQKSVLAKVQEHMTHPDDADILHENDVKFGPPVKDVKSGKTKVDVQPGPSADGSRSSNSEWQEVRSHLDINSHISKVDHGKYAPKSGLEKKVDAAVDRGDIATAEKLSDQLATREFGSKIASAFEAKEFLKRKKEEEEVDRKKKKKKLSWGFEHKQRWEMKSNM